MGTDYYSKLWECRKILPIYEWTEKQVWDYTKEANIPINPFYTKWGGIYKGCGCLPCTAYLSWRDRLSVSHPKLFSMLLKLDGQSQLELRGQKVNE